MNKDTKFSSKAWCSECRQYIADPSEVGSESEGICPHYGWPLLKPDVNELEDNGDIISGSGTSTEREESPLVKKEKPVFKQGGEIAAQGKVQFSRGREEEIKSDPIEHRQQDAGMMGTLVGVLLGLCAVVAVFLFLPQGKSKVDGGGGREGADIVKVMNPAVKTREEVVNFIDEVSRIEDVDKLLEVIRFPELLEPLVRARHETFGTDHSILNELSVLNYSDSSLLGSRFGVLILGRSDDKPLMAALVEIEDDGELRIDWEILVGAGQRYWQEFDEKQPTEAVPLWVSMHRTSIVGVPLPVGEDPEQWMAVKVMSPVLGLRGKTYLTLVKKGDAFGDYVEKYIPWNTQAPNGRVMTVSARFTGGPSPMLMVDELRAPGSLRSAGDDQVFPLGDW